MKRPEVNEIRWGLHVPSRECASGGDDFGQLGHPARLCCFLVHLIVATAPGNAAAPTLQSASVLAVAGRSASSPQLSLVERRLSVRLPR